MTAAVNDGLIAGAVVVDGGCIFGCCWIADGWKFNIFGGCDWVCGWVWACAICAWACIISNCWAGDNCVCVWSWILTFLDMVCGEYLYIKKKGKLFVTEILLWGGKFIGQRKRQK